MAEEFFLKRLGMLESHHKVTSGELSIGRDAHAFISCTSPYVSRKHLVLIRKLHSPHIYIKDLNTANGTFLNNKRIAPGKLHEVKENDVIMLGLYEDTPTSSSYMFQLVKNTQNNVIVIDDDEMDMDKTLQEPNILENNDKNTKYAENNNINNLEIEKLPNPYNSLAHSSSTSNTNGGVESFKMPDVPVLVEKNKGTNDELTNTDNQKSVNSEMQKDQVLQELEEMFMSQPEIQDGSDKNIKSCSNTTIDSSNFPCVRLDPKTLNGGTTSLKRSISDTSFADSSYRCKSAKLDISSVNKKNHSSLLTLPTKPEILEKSQGKIENNAEIKKSKTDCNKTPKTDLNSKEKSSMKTPSKISSVLKKTSKLLKSTISNEKIAPVKKKSPTKKSDAITIDSKDKITPAKKKSPIKKSTASINESKDKISLGIKKTSVKKPVKSTIILNELPDTIKPVKSKKSSKEENRSFTVSSSTSETKQSSSKKSNTKIKNDITPVSSSKEDCKNTRKKPTSAKRLSPKSKTADPSTSITRISSASRKSLSTSSTINISSPSDQINLLPEKGSTSSNNNDENYNKTAPGNVTNVLNPKIMNRIPKSLPRESNHEMVTRRKSVMDDLYNSQESKPSSGRRKSVSFLLTDKQNVKNYKRSSSTGLRSILKSDESSSHVVGGWMNFLVNIIIRWNPAWVPEYTKIKSEKKQQELPPIFYENKSAVPLLTYLYKDITQYIISFTNVVILEIWELVYNAMTSGKNAANNQTYNVNVIGGPLFSGTKINKIACKLVCASSRELEKQIGHGTLCIVKFPKLNKGEYFALIDDYDSKTGNNDIKLTFFMRTDVNIQNKIKDRIPVTIKPITSIRNELMLVKAIHCIEASPLCNIITSPQQGYFNKFKSSSPLQWNHELNPSQKKTVQQCICAISSHIPTIQMIHGPPGTGKSRVITALILEYFKRNTRNKSKGKVLICSQTNIAIDEIVKRLLDIKKEHNVENLFKLVRVGRFENMQPWAQEISSNRLAENFYYNPEMSNQVKILKEQIDIFKKKKLVEGPHGAYSAVQYEKYKKKLKDTYATKDALYKEELEVIQRADVITSTLQGCSASKMQKLYGKIAFCVIDEAAKALEPETLIPLSLGVECLIMVGDDQQLPGFIFSQQAKTKGFNESMFSRLLQTMSSWEKSSVLKLDTQYRMVPSIAYFPNEAFYGGELKNGKKYPPLPRLIPEYRVIHIPADDCVQRDSGANINEAKIVARIALAIQEITVPLNLGMCILTPYSGQKEALHAQLRRLSCSNIEVYTVDSFQGQERDIIIISLARSEGPGFLIDPGRMSVLLTRAKRSCIVCCNPDFVKGQPLWESFLSDAKKRDVKREISLQLLHQKKNILEYIV